MVRGGACDVSSATTTACVEGRPAFSLFQLDDPLDRCRLDCPVPYDGAHLAFYPLITAVLGYSGCPRVSTRGPGAQSADVSAGAAYLQQRISCRCGSENWHGWSAF